MFGDNAWLSFVPSNRIKESLTTGEKHDMINLVNY